jgi:CRISPR-associated endonuclease/helicase Cas3
MTSELRADEFPVFFRALHGYEPFPWQTRLASRVFTAGWPEKALDVPTAAGKTAAIDIAVFNLALEADRGIERRAPVRILFVVDRRLIVDDAYNRATTIAKKIASRSEDILSRVAIRLQILAEEDKSPLLVARLRGGAPQEPDWVRTPAQPTVVVSTVDQVGSRLLFRGYGVSDTMKPVHAGLLGADALFLLDEAHLSQPFVQTARDSRIFQEKGTWSEDATCAPLQIVTLSATQADDSDPFVLEDDYSHPVLGPRLSCAKRATLVKSDDGPDDARFANSFAEQAWALSRVDAGTATVVAVVVNRVRRARLVFEKLKDLGARPLEISEDNSTSQNAESPADVALLIGRAREIERRELLDHLLPRISAKNERRETDRPLFIVATQCVEAGADLDFDALVTELAPLDSLRQRFGRLNRMGKRTEAQAAILGSSTQVAKSANRDAIYGEALRETWSLLTTKCQTVGTGKKTTNIIDFGVKASASWLPGREEIAPYLAPRASAPVLLPRDVMLWSRTSPIPVVDPEVSLYLHGPENGPGDVEIVWRADLEGNETQDWIDCVSACPPSALESISVPVGEARRWLRHAAHGDVSDDEGSGLDEDEGRIRNERPALCWRGSNDVGTRAVGGKDIRPGDMLIVRSREGGCDRWGWAPEKLEPVRDLGREANLENRSRNILRLSRTFLGDMVGAESERLSEMTDAQIVAAFSKHLIKAAAESPLQPVGRITVIRDDAGTPLVLEQRVRRLKDAATLSGDPVTEDEQSLRASQRAILLDAHCQGVRSRAQHFAEQLGLTPALINDLRLAGFLHDGGKAHPSFKALLYGGDELAAFGGPPLAKSNKLPASRLAWIEACRRAGFQRGGRHELASLAFAFSHPKLAQASDPSLVLWLIGTHHGYGRPFFPTVDWPGESGATIESDLGDGLVVATCTTSLSVLD